MMWKIILTLAITFGGCMAVLNPACKPQKCKHFLDEIQEIDAEEFAYLTAQRFIEVCPNLLDFTQCISQELETCANTNFEKLAASDDERTAALGKILLGTSELVIDLCDENTQIHKDFIENVECIIRTLGEQEKHECRTEAHSLFLSYTGGLRETESNYDCIYAGYLLACASGQVNMKCGEVARNTLIDMVKRSKIIQNQMCSPEDIQELKTEFLEHLQLEGERQSIFEQAFDLRKRK